MTSTTHTPNTKKSARRVIVRGITIDGEFSKDLDDAFWASKTPTGYDVQISISDAAKAVPVGSEADVEAASRIETVYRHFGNRPMLPRELADDKLSLLPGKARKTITLFVKLSEDGVVESCEIKRSRLRSLFRLSHARCDQELLNPNGRLHNLVLRCQQVAWKLYKIRRANGALAFYDVESKLYSDEDGIIRKYGDEFFHAQMIVQEFMILANEQVAKLLAQSGRLAIYRNHRARPSSPQRADFINRVNEALDHKDLLPQLRNQMHLWMEKAQYGLSVDGHFGLSLDAYCHFTSPIRRYADLVLHRIVRAMLKGEPEPYSREQLEVIVTKINDWHKTQDEAQASHFKQKAQNQMRDLGLRSAENLRKMPISKFSSVLKQAIKDDKPTPDIELVLQERIRRGDISAFDVYYLAFHASSNWKSTKDVLCEELAKRPYFAVMALEILKARDQANYAFSTVGSFQSWVQVLWGSVPTRSAAIQAPSKKLSQNLAAADWVVGHMLGRQMFDDGQAPVAEVVKDEGPVNWVGRLNEWCQTRQKSVEFRYESFGPSHCPSFRCHAVLDGNVVTAEAATKREAKGLAAEKMVKSWTHSKHVN